MLERGVAVDHTTLFRWVQRYAPEINRRMRPHMKMSGTSYRLDETYVKVSTGWKYLYRAIDRVYAQREARCFCYLHQATLTIDIYVEREYRARVIRVYDFLTRPARFPVGFSGLSETAPPH